MNIITEKENLLKLVVTQLKNNFLCTIKEEKKIDQILDETLEKTHNCFKEINNKYYWNNNVSIFNPFRSDQCSIFLYFLSNLVWKNYNDSLLADKIYCLNKMLNSSSLFYEIDLPSIFFLEHAVGSVMGRASFKNYFIFQQNCTVGANKKVYPVLGEFVWLFTNSMVIGSSKIGSNVFISANSLVKDEEIPDNSIVFGQSPNLVIKNKPPLYFYERSPFKEHQSLAEKMKSVYS